MPQLQSDRPLEVGQLVEAGDATFRLDGNRLWVSTRLGGTRLRRVAARPPTITPNGDGTNDRTHIEYSLMHLAEAGAVRVDIFDLSGRLVRQVYAGHDPSGESARPWDGRDEHARTVRPGLYLFRVRVDADGGRNERSGVIAVVY